MKHKQQYLAIFVVGIFLLQSFSVMNTSAAYPDATIKSGGTFDLPNYLGVDYELVVGFSLIQEDAKFLKYGIEGNSKCAVIEMDPSSSWDFAHQRWSFVAEVQRDSGSTSVPSVRRIDKFEVYLVFSDISANPENINLNLKDRTKALEDPESDTFLTVASYAAAYAGKYYAPAGVLSSALNYAKSSNDLKRTIYSGMDYYKFNPLSADRHNSISASYDYGDAARNDRVHQLNFIFDLTINTSIKSFFYNVYFVYAGLPSSYTEGSGCFNPPPSNPPNPYE